MYFKIFSATAFFIFLVSLSFAETAIDNMNSATLNHANSIVHDAMSSNNDRETARLIIEMHNHNPSAAKAAYDNFMEQKKREAIINSSPQGEVLRPLSLEQMK